MIQRYQHALHLGSESSPLRTGPKCPTNIASFPVLIIGINRCKNSTEGNLLRKTTANPNPTSLPTQKGLDLSPHACQGKTVPRTRKTQMSRTLSIASEKWVWVSSVCIESFQFRAVPAQKHPRSSFESMYVSCG